MNRHNLWPVCSKQNLNFRDQPVISFGCFKALLKQIIIRVPSARSLANLGIPEELGIVALECPEPLRPERIAPHLLSLLAPILYRIYVLSEFPVPLLRVLHHPQDQILSKFHYEAHFLPPFPARRIEIKLLSNDPFEAIRRPVWNNQIENSKVLLRPSSGNSSSQTNQCPR